jgi:outer membrane protein, multidrug efflux system
MAWSYIVDLWGKIRSEYQSAKFAWEAELESFNAVFLLLTTDIASVYYQIRTLDAQLNLLLTTLELREKAFEINQSKYKYKLIDYVDVSRAGLEINNAMAEYQEVLRRRSVLENHLAVLIGTPPSEFCLEFHPLEGEPPNIPAGIPSEVLIRRPDIAEAERMMASQFALVKAAYASFFPSLELTGTLGYFSPHLRYFLHNFSRLWGFAAFGSQVLFDAGQLQARLANEQAQFAETVNVYKQKVLVAFEDVENALTDLNNYRNEYVEIYHAVQWSNKTYEISESKYRRGLTSYLDVVFSERDLLANEMILNDLKGIRFLSTIHLIRALGGGWNQGVNVPVCE